MSVNASGLDVKGSKNPNWRGVRFQKNVLFAVQITK